MISVLDELTQVLAQRKSEDPNTSYVASLHAKGLNKILEKIGEESTEVILAAKDASSRAGTKTEVVRETADLWFHTMVMLAHLDLHHTDVLNVLDARMGLSGLAEKAARKGHNAASEDA